MSDVFDPYRQWLGLDLGHPPRDHGELLGLTTNHPDANAVVNARDHMLKKLRDVQPEERGKAWEQMVEQIHEAGRCLLMSDVLADEDRQSRSVPIAAPPATMATQGSNQAVPLARLISATLPAEPPVETSLPVAEDEMLSARSVVTRRTSRRRRRGWSLWGPPLILAVVLGLVLWGVLHSELWDDFSVASQTDVPPTVWQSVRDQAGAVNPVQQPITREDKPAAVRAKIGRAWVQDQQTGSRPGKGSVPVRLPRDKTLDLADVEQEMVRKVLAALARQEFDRAKDSIKTLTTTNQQMGGSLNMLKIYVGFYWEGVEEAWQTLQPGRELRYRGQKGTVVERSDRELVIRVAGRNETIDVKPIEPWLEEQLADAWFDQGDAANWMSIGAREFVRPGGNLKQVRRHWERAARAGEPADRLLPLLKWPHLRP